MKFVVALFGLLLSSTALHAASSPADPAPAAAFVLAQSQDGGDAAPTKDVDINVSIGEESSAPARDWWTQPIWIAVFIIGGIAVLTLLVVASRGSSSPATIVKG